MSRRLFPIASSKNLLAFLAVGLLLLNILVGAPAAVSLQISRHQYETRAIVATQNLARVLEHDIATVFDKIDLALIAEQGEISRQLADDGIDEPALNKFMAQLLARQPELENLRYVDVRGDIVYGTNMNRAAPVNVVDRDYFIRLRDTTDPGLVISKPVFGRISGEWIIILGRRVTEPDAAFRGAVLATISLRHFETLLSTLDLGTQGAVSLRDSELGLVVRHSAAPRASAAVGSRLVSNELGEVLKRHPTDGTYIAHTKMDGIERANAYRKIAGYPYYIIVGLATEDFLAEWRHEAFKTIALAVLVLVVSLALSWTFYRSWMLREALSRRVVAVQEEERRRLATELHDNTSPNLAALSLNLRMLAEDLGAGPSSELETRLADTRALLENTTAGIRNVCAYLRPATLDYVSLYQALREYAEQFSRRTSIAVNVSGPNAGTRLPTDIEFTLFRVVQEALTNCAKHANASAVDIHLVHDEVHATLTISDNGSGFDHSALGLSGSRPGLGLLSMRERVELAGGRIEIASQAGKGTLIRVEI